MANANRPFGLRPHSSLNGGPYNGNIRQYCVPATDTTAIFIGDPVKLAGSESKVNADDMLFPTATKAASTEVVAGVCVGVIPTPSDLSVLYRKASTAMYILVDTDPNTIYAVQGNNATWDGDDVGLNANFTVSTASTTTGTSNLVLNQSTAATTTTLDLQILGSAPIIDNDLSGVYPVILVRLNNHQFVDGVTGL